ncbi:hypothetical protein GAPWKB30_0940 [Gilliamella apicola]|nr:hypothetical protein GAPWKB30_0940 [Gilliamella apicola]
MNGRNTFIQIDNNFLYDINAISLVGDTALILFYENLLQ